MLLRIAGALAVILGCAGLGFYYSSKEGFRINELQEFKKALLILSSEIEYMRAPLNIACANIAKRTELTISTLFSQFAQLLADSEGETAYQLWATAMESLKSSTFLAHEDLSVADGFGKTLGYLDKNMQQNAINHAINYIDEKTAALQTQGDKNKRMYRSLGVICGLLITVVLW
ncbi:MAG: stage III sporulation protein AB [Firmicutes bacterium]|nr:stage III sporulation protein AB [Bacillota bacterium]